MTLLKAGTFEVMLVHLACLFDSKNNTMLFVNGNIFQRTSASLVRCLHPVLFFGSLLTKSYPLFAMLVFGRIYDYEDYRDLLLMCPSVHRPCLFNGYPIMRCP